MTYDIDLWLEYTLMFTYNTQPPPPPPPTTTTTTTTTAAAAAAESPNKAETN